jgi:hypothetical protein
MALYVVVEGDGDRVAVPNLLARLGTDLGYGAPHWAPPLKINVRSETDAQRAAGLVRPRQDAGGLLILRDDEDGCPRDNAPEIARWLKALALPFPAACVLFYREYETLFLPCLDTFAGRPLTTGAIERPGLDADARFDGDPEQPRDAKRVLTSAMPPGRAYKETTDQLSFTRMLDFARLRESGLACFATLERALHFLLGGKGSAGEVFPIDR